MDIYVILVEILNKPAEVHGWFDDAPTGAQIEKYVKSKYPEHFKGKTKKNISYKLLTLSGDSINV